MRSIQVELPDETIRALAVETDLLEFETVEAYLSWIVQHRYAIDHGTERDQLLSEYAERMADLDLENVQTPPAAKAGQSNGPTDQTDTTSMEARGVPSVARIEDDSLEEIADSLSNVEGGRLDEFVRRAMTRTREQLGDGVGTGIDYSSRDALDDDVRLGEEITDLDAIEVPGWDETLVAKRREAVGAALAFLKDVEEAKRADFVAELYEDYPAGYESESSWWECIKTGLRQVDRVNPGREGSRTWSFRTTPGRVKRISYSA
jgi:hypothetical protein